MTEINFKISINGIEQTGLKHFDSDSGGIGTAGAGAFKVPKVFLVMGMDDNPNHNVEEIVRKRFYGEGTIIIISPKEILDEVALKMKSELLAETLGISEDEAKNLIKNGFAQHPKPLKIEPSPMLPPLTISEVKEKKPTGYYEGTRRRHNRNNFKYHNHRRK